MDDSSQAPVSVVSATPVSPTPALSPQSSVLRLLASPVFHTFLILTIALGIRLMYWADAHAYSLAADEPDYVIPAQTLLREGRYVDTFVSHERMWTRVPLTALLFAGSFLGVTDPVSAGAQGDDAALMERRYAALNLIQIAVSLVTIVLLMLLAARAFPQRSRPVSIIAGYIAALYPPLASSPAQRALSEPLAVMMACLALYVLSHWSPSLVWRRSLVLAGSVGAILGIAALARSVALAFVPLACLWLLVTYWAARREEAALHVSGNSHRVGAGDAEGVEKSSHSAVPSLKSKIQNPLLASGVLIVTCLLAIAPWTLFNYTQYRSFLLLETANATAYWHYHNFRGEDYEKRLLALPDPADRLALIVKEGTANILEYPDKAISASVFAFGYFWHLESNSGVLLNPWDMTQRDPDVPDLLHSDAAFLLVGLIGMAGLAGVGIRRPVGLGGRTLLLLNLWLLGMVLLGIIVPYDGRYRLPAIPSIIILAAGLLALTDWRTVFSPRRAIAALRAHPRVALATSVLLIWVLWGAYTPNIPPMLRSFYLAWRGDMALSSGDEAGAWGRYTLAQQAFPSFFWPYRHHADMASGAGRDDEARALYAESRERSTEDPYSILGFADLYARHSEWELAVGERQWLRREEADWRGNPWNSFEPSPTSRIEVGNGGDIPYLRGFHRADRTPEMDYRWSRGRAVIRVPIEEGGGANAILLRMSAPAVGAGEPMTVSVLVGGGAPVSLQVPVGWADYSLSIPRGTAAPGKTLWIEITSPTRTPSLVETGSRDDRGLGVGLDWVQMVVSP